ncbi:MAG: stage II sporulation protein D [Oscillospiraceae bacterium]|nr:stage II sporulation protein D [Oscillospiraceae bacterium]
MKRCVFCSFLALLISFWLPGPSAPAEVPPAAAALRAPSAPLSAPERPDGAEELPEAPFAAPERIRLLADGEIRELPLEEYLVGVVAAEMPAEFHVEALKAQAVAARSYTLSCAASRKHGEADVCADYRCCQAWKSEEALRALWGEAADERLSKLRAAVEATAGEVLCWEDEPIVAAFHASSAGRTEDCAAIWSPRPYLVSVPSPETAGEVPNYVSTVSVWPTDFRDSLLALHPEADFSTPESRWIGELYRDASGRVSEAVLGGVYCRGTELRSLFSLRSTAFTLEYSGGLFVFTVTGSGHGVGMSQYGAQVMAENGADYRAVLEHYYTGAELMKMRG